MKFIFHTFLFLILCIPASAQWGSLFNSPPTIDPIADYGPIPENSGAHDILLTGISSGDIYSNQIVTITATTDNSDLITSLYVQYSQGSTAHLIFGLKPNINGKAEITVRLDDGQTYRNITEESFVVTVSPVNGKPSFSLPNNLVEVEENQGKIDIKNFTINMEDGDPEVDQKLEFVLSIKSISPSLDFKSAPQIDAKNGTLKFEAKNNTSGEAVISLILKDNGGTGNGGNDTSDEVLFTIRVKNINDPPTLDDIPSPMTISEDALEHTITLTGISAGENEDQELMITATSDNQVLVSNLTIIYQQGSTTGQLLISTNSNQFGNAQITVIVNDGQEDDNIISRQFTLDVNPVADTPSITDAVYEGGPYTTSGLVITRNPVDGPEVDYFKITNIQNGTLYFNNGTTQIQNNDFIDYNSGQSGLKFSPIEGISSNGSFDVQAATDPNSSGLGGSIVSAQIVVDNDPPEIVTEPDSIVEITKPYNYDIVATDPNELDVLKYTISIPVEVRPWLRTTIGNDGTALIYGTPPSGSTGIFQIIIKVEDQFGAFDEQVFNLYVNELNKLPVLAPFSVSIQEDDTIFFSLEDFAMRFTDNDGDTLSTLKIISVPQYGNLYLDGLELGLNDEISSKDLNDFQYIPNKNYFGLDIFDWNASDGKDYAQVPQRLNVFISSVNDPPEIENFEENPFTFEYAEESIAITDSGVVIDADGDKIQKAIVSIGANYRISEDTLYYGVFEDFDFIWQDTIGVLTIKGIATPSIYQEVLRSIQYVNLNRLAPSGRTREISIVLFDSDTFSISYIREIEFKNTFVELDIPTGFTPNDDGVNDTWDIENLGRYEDYQIAVYSRSGEVVFESNNYMKEWDGSQGGSLVPVGAYYYVISINKFEKVFKGTVTVLR